MAGNESLNCQEIQNLLSDGQYSRQALAHMQDCEICLQFLLDHVLPARDDASAPLLFTQRILAKLPASTDSHPVSLALRLVIAESLIAATLMGLFFSDLIALSLSFWGSALLLAVSVQLTFVVLWVAGRTRV